MKEFKAIGWKSARGWALMTLWMLVASLAACGGGGGGNDDDDVADDDDDTDQAECGNGTLEAGEQCEGVPGCGSDCRCQAGFEPVGAGGCEALETGELTPAVAEDVALTTVNDIQFQQTSEGMAQPDDYLRGYLRGKVGRGAAKRLAQAVEIGELPDCAHVEDFNCCSPSDPCGWAADGICDCEGEYPWDEADCGVVVDCCTEDNPCIWAEDGICDCGGTTSWDTADCATIDCCTDENLCNWSGDGICDCNAAFAWDDVDCEGYVDCCTEDNLCNWAEDSYCDCGGTTSWDTVDCSAPQLDCCAADNPCNWAEDGICDCDGATAWDTADCQGEAQDDCCSETNPCDWADDGICDCGGTASWDANDCAGWEITDQRFYLIFDPGCRVGEDVLEGTIRFELYEYTDAGSSYSNQFIGFEDFFENGEPVKGEVYSNRSAYTDETCSGFNESVEYYDFSSPSDGYIDGAINVFEGECLYEGGVNEAYRSAEFDDFIFEEDLINISYEYYALDGYLDIELRVSGTRGGVPIAGYYDYTETDIGDGQLQIEGSGRNFSNDVGGEVTLDFMYTQAQGLCGQIPLDGTMNMTVGGESREVSFSCDDLSAQ